jgi:hypothetical protein
VFRKLIILHCLVSSLSKFSHVMWGVLFYYDDCLFSISRIKSEKVYMKISVLPENAKNLLKAGIFHFGSENLPTFLHTSLVMSYNWVEDETEPVKKRKEF